MPDRKTAPRRKLKFATAKLTDEESALLDRACARKGITRTDAVLQSVRPLIESQRTVEAMRPLRST